MNTEELILAVDYSEKVFLIYENQDETFQTFHYCLACPIIFRLFCQCVTESQKSTNQNVQFKCVLKELIQDKEEKYSDSSFIRINVDFKLA